MTLREEAGAGRVAERGGWDGPAPAREGVDLQVLCVRHYDAVELPAGAQAAVVVPDAELAQRPEVGVAPRMLNTRGGP